MFMTWFMFSCNYHCLGMSQWANIRNANSLVVKPYVESKQRQPYGFLKPEYPFKYVSYHWKIFKNYKKIHSIKI